MRADRWLADGRVFEGGEGQTVLKTMVVCCLPGLANQGRGSKGNRPIWVRKNAEK
jgi:hypothetical protein